MLDAGVDYEDWEEIGQSLADVAVSLPFAIGDWHNYGKAKFGTRAEGAELHGIHPDTISTYGWAAERIPISERRIPELTFSHHRLVARMERPERKKWLDTAVAERWDTRTMRAKLLAAKAIEPKSVGGDGDGDPSPGLPNPPSYTPREALVTIRQDETWRQVADSALAMMDDPDVIPGVNGTCPACGQPVG